MSQVPKQHESKSTVSSIGSRIVQPFRFIYNLKQNIKKSESYKNFIQVQEQLNHEYLMPVKNFYNETKIQLLSEYSFNQRFTIVNVLALITTVLTIKRFHNVELFSKSLLAIRNTAISYFIGGLFIAPEIYNPLMKDQ